MNGQARKNLRQALPGVAFGTPDWEASQAAASWVVDNDNHQYTTDFLGKLGLLTIARRCLVEGVPLEVAGEAGPYGSVAQQRAWAAGMLASACRAMVVAANVKEERLLAARKIWRLERQAELLRAETRAAARFKDIDVPFREKRQKSVNWDAA